MSAANEAHRAMLIELAEADLTKDLDPRDADADHMRAIAKEIAVDLVDHVLANFEKERERRKELQIAGPNDPVTPADFKRVIDERLAEMQSAGALVPQGRRIVARIPLHRVDDAPAVVPCCALDQCWAHGVELGMDWSGPCWGEVIAIDEDYGGGDFGPGEPWHEWIHGCEGHRERWGAYVPPPSEAPRQVDGPLSG